MKILVIDNYDSFTHNLVQLVGSLGVEVVVVRNDKISVEEVEKLNPDRILISPGPGRPEDSGISLQVIRMLGPHIPLMGVCLGHQAIGAAFGGRVVNAAQLMHGKTSTIQHDSKTIFEGIDASFEAGRYHSLVIDRDTLPPELIMSAGTDNNQTIMGVRHVRFPIEGIQFHPESILTNVGEKIIRNWINYDYNNHTKAN